MLYIKEAKGSIEQVSAKLEAAAAANHMGVLGVHNLKQKMAANGVTFGPECRVFEVCNPVQAKMVLEANMSILTALPCRISVYQEAGKVMVSTMRPTALLALFRDETLKLVALEVETAIFRMIDEACR